MRYKVSGKSGVRISEVALGTMTFGEDWGWGASPDVSARMLDLFADAGGNVVDTADVYTSGTSETILGELLKGRRDRFVLATKFTNQTDLGDPNSAGNHRKKIVNSIEASLRRLQTDHIDLYWVHNRDVLTSVEELMRALDVQVRLGKILYPAVSDWRGGRSRKPTPPLGCVIGHRSPRSSCGTTCLTVPRSGNYCPWPTRSTCRYLPGARLPKDGSPANTSAARPAERPRLDAP